ncbi:MAG: macro domain-containing protein [Gammaproteobacteria bacterium]|nr:macro domain-containing protein [Gammaproteobacteria bacterium]MDE0301935.1 macro domain-containing protein [Gammaproteobacteria bacterium]MDE0611657.1 macro domain-containing protein [Gammaproteobacteria bacterium]
MIQSKIGDILAEDAEALVNTVNCVGVMGRGIALQFKKAYPQNFKAYADACAREKVRLGQVFVHELNQSVNPRYIINFPTKNHWRDHSRLEDIEVGLKSLIKEIQERDIRSVAIPPLGSGLGGLEWEKVRVCIEKALSDLHDLHVVVFEPNEDRDLSDKTRQEGSIKMTAGRAALVGLVNHYLSSLLDPFVTLLEVHKLMYFMQVSGEPLRLNYKKEIYGPYAENLRHVLKEIEGYFLFGYADGGDAPKKRLELIPGAVEQAQAFLEGSTETQLRFNKVVDLVTGYESAFGLELMATVHWVLEEEKPESIEDTIEQVYGWNERKRKFSKTQIEFAAARLKDKGWVSSSETFFRDHSLFCN